jgi:glycosyltransferase involved in cell wall biosynthesis
MRIAFLTELFPPSIGGQEVRFAELASALAVRGHTVEVLCIKHADDLPTREDIKPGVSVLRRPFVEKYRRSQGSLLPRSLVGMVKFAWAARGVLRRGRFDLVFVSQWPLLHVLTLPSRDRKRAVIDWCEIRHSSPYRLFQNLLPRLVKANTAVSEEVRKHIAARSPGPVFLLPSGIARERYHAAEDRGRAGLLYLGRIAHHKNVPLLIKAYDELCRRGSTENLTIAGSGPAMDEVKAAIAESPYKERITLAGTVTEERKLELLSQSRILVLPSQREGFPRVVAEAMASGLPTVTTRYPGNGTVTVVESFDCGLCAEPEAIALANAIETVLSRWEKFSERSSAGASRLDWASVVVEFEKFLGQVLAKPVSAS